MAKVNVGDRFGKLVVLDEDGYYYHKKTGYKHERKYKCQCDCGNVVSVRKANLIYGNTKSCGCSRYERDFNYSPTYQSCIYCGSDNHYSGGMCRNCYFKSMRGTLSKEIESMISVY